MRGSLKDLYFPAQYLEIGAALLRAGGGDEAGFFQWFGLSKADLATPGLRVSADQIQSALCMFIDNCAPGVAPSLQFMEHFPITAHGPLGLLMLTHKNLGEALDAGIQYYHLLTPVFSLRRQDIGDKTHFLLEPAYELGRATEFLVEMALLTVFKLLPFLSRQPSTIHAHFTHAAVGSPENYSAAFAAVFHFQSSQNKLVITREDLTIPLQTHSPTSSATFRRVLEQQDRDTQDRKPVAQRASQLLRRAMEQRKALDAEQLAGQMCLSTRTLSRRLRQEGTSLPALEVSVRVDYAQVLLLDSRKSIGEISRQVGFGDTASFSRAFKRIVGKTPREFRG